MEHSPQPNRVDLLLLVAETVWAEEGLDQPTAEIYTVLAVASQEVTTLSLTGGWTAMRFTLKHTKLTTLLARVPIGLVGTALTTSALIEEFRPSIVVQVGFGGILSDDLRLGDVAIASQVDCYLAKGKAAPSRIPKTVGTRIAFAGEVFRPTHSLVQLAMNFKHVFPNLYAEFQTEVRNSPRRLSLLDVLSDQTRVYFRSDDADDIAVVHAVHFASADVVSTTTEAVKWLRSRDRKLDIVDMESGGVLAAVEQYNHRHDRTVETLIIRGAGGYGDERHDTVVRKIARELHQFAFETACRFLCQLLSSRSKELSGDAMQRAVDLGILLPLEEEFSYLADLLRSSSPSISIGAEYREGRYYYRFTRNGITCAVTFVGTMGLVNMALAADDFYRAFTPGTLVVMGIAAGFSGPDGDVKVCDVVIAQSVDTYFHRSRMRMETIGSNKGEHKLEFARLRNDPPIMTSEAFISLVNEDPSFALARTKWSDVCARELAETLKELPSAGHFAIEHLGIGSRPQIHVVRLASGEFVAAAREFVELLVNRGCSAVDMESGGAAMAYQWFCNNAQVQPAPKLLILRGISDKGDENKKSVETAIKPSLFRRACVRNAGRLLLVFLENERFAALIARSRRVLAG
jgi:nucleoside phosphorylase